MKKFLPFLILIFLVSFIGFSTYKLGKKQQIVQDTNLISKTYETNFRFVRTKIILPEFSLPDLYDQNQSFSKKDLIKKYSIVNFFASWCVTCHAEHQILLHLHDKEIIDIYGIAWRDIDTNTRQYLQKNGNPFKKIAKDSKGFFTEIAGIASIPQTMIIDPKGNVVMRYSGNLGEFSISEIWQFLQENNAL
jgi:cytochrome c biogenesis protein CcmG/thiol:disulfide interchange protein DsbE